MTPEARARILEAGCDHAEPGTTLVCRECVGAMIAEEREACAKLSESRQWHSNAAECSGECADDIARAIRARL